MKHLIWFILAIGAAYGTQLYYQQQYGPQVVTLQGDLEKAKAAQKEAEARATAAEAELADATRQATEAVAGQNQAVKEALAARQSYEDRLKALSAEQAARSGTPPPAEAPASSAAPAPAPPSAPLSPEAQRIADLRERLRVNIAQRNTLRATLAEKQQDLIAWQAQGANHAKGTDLPVQIGALQKELDDALGEIEVIQKQLPAGGN